MKSKDENWIEWVEPFGPNDEPVYKRVSKSTAIAVMKDIATRKGIKYPNDNEALMDFMVVHWAWEIEGEI